MQSGQPQSRNRFGSTRLYSAIESLRLDAKLGVRMLIKYPGLALVGAFGIAVAVAIAAGGFSVIYGTYLAPSLPLEEGDRIVSIQVWDSAANAPERRVLHDYKIWREELKATHEVGAFRTVTPNLITPEARPQSIRVASMSASGFRVARVQPLIGRHIVEEDEREGAPAVIVISESIWRNQFGSDPGILRKTIQLGTTAHSVVGVMPEGFAFPVNHRFWVPLRVGSGAQEPLTGPELMVFGRLARGATLESAQTELATVTGRSAVAFPKIYAQLQPRVMPYANPFLGIHQAEDVAGLHMINGIVGMLLVLVCLNVAILVYTRTAMRRAEISVRTALGASRSRIVVQLFIEAFVLSAVGTVAGVAIAEFALRQVSAATVDIASELPFWLSFHLSPQAVVYAGALSVLAAAIVGVVPGLQATRAIQAGARVVGAGGSGLRLGKMWTALIVIQVGFAVALLPAAVFTTWDNLWAELGDPGFAAGEFLTAQLGMEDVQERSAGRQMELLRRLEAEPQVSSATFAMSIPGDEPEASIETEAISSGTSGSAAGSGTSGHEVRFNRVDVDFFRALDVPILAGRGFEAADASSAEVGSGKRTDGRAVVVNQTFARRIFGGNALGRRFRYTGGSASGTRDWYEIVGIVRDFPAGVSAGMKDSPLRLYHPVAAGQVNPLNIAVRVRGGDPAEFGQRLSEVAASIDPDLQVKTVITMKRALHKEQWLRRLEAAVLGAISLGVLLLSSAGIYALMSFTVSQRRKEIGIRMALGADRTRIVASIFSRALGQLAIGAVVGGGLAALVENMSGDTLMRGHATVVLSAVGLFMMGVGLLAALGPARRCLEIEPTEALREQ